MKSAQLRLAPALLAMLASSTAPATPPPPPPPHARYGPLTQCLGGYAVTVAPSEAIYVMDGGISLVTQDYLINLSLELPDPFRGPPTSEFDHPLLGRIARYETGQGEGRRIENRLPPIEGGRAVVVRSSVGEEQIALTRVIRADAGRVECGTFTAPDFPGEHPDALYWAPLLIPGPLYRCERRIGYALREGEGMRAPWPTWAHDKPSRVVLRTAHLAIHGPYRTPSGFVGPIAAGYRMSVGYDDYRGPYLYLSPPRSFLRRQPRNERYDYDFRIEFAPGGEFAARQFATRLEFVDSGEPRCNANRE